MKRFRPKAWQSVLVLAALAPVLLDGCVSIGVSRSKTAAEAATGSLDVIVVEKSGDAKPTASRVITRLVRLESGVEQPISESSDPTWTKSDLAARPISLACLALARRDGKGPAIRQERPGELQDPPRRARRSARRAQGIPHRPRHHRSRPSWESASSSRLLISALRGYELQPERDKPLRHGIWNATRARKSNRETQSGFSDEP